MKRIEKLSLLTLALAFVLSGCVVRTYPLTRDRVDQDLTTGNRGFIKGTESPSSSTEEKKTTRTTQIVEVEFRPLVKFEKAPKQDMSSMAIQETQTEEVMGNRGYITQSVSPEIAQVGAYETYKVQRGDTLQKISQRFYGTTKKWTKIYDANRDVLKGPNKVYPGQTLNIPTEGMKETKQNLK